MNIVINGAGFVNKGAEAMARTVQTQLARRLRGCEFYLWRPSDIDRRPALDSGFTPFQLPFEEQNTFWYWPGGRRIASRLWGLTEICRIRDIGEIYGALKFGQRYRDRVCGHYLNRVRVQFDALIDISGFAYGDVWGIGGLRRVAPLVDHLGESDRPVVFLPQAWGSFDKVPVRRALQSLLGHHNVTLYSRDEASSRHLEQALGKPLGSVSVAPDIVFGSDGSTEEQGEHILQSMGCTLNRPIIGIAPNMRVYERIGGKGTGNAYLQALVRLVNYCHANYDADVVLQANEIAVSDHRQDDRYLCSLIAASVGDPSRCFMTRDRLTAEATKALIGRFEYLVGSRYHSLVFGLSQGIPATAVSWSHKYRELFSLFGMEEQVQECQTLNAATLIEVFQKGWRERKWHQASIVERAEHLRREVNLIFDEVAEQVDRGVGGGNA